VTHDCNLFSICLILVQFPVGARGFSLLQSVQTTSRAHPVPHLMGTEGSLHRVQATEAWNRSLTSTHCQS